MSLGRRQVPEGECGRAAVLTWHLFTDQDARGRRRHVFHPQTKGQAKFQNLVLKFRDGVLGAIQFGGEDRLITKVDRSWYPDWIGSEQTRFFRLDGETLSLSSPYQDHPKFPGARVHSVVICVAQRWRCS